MEDKEKTNENGTVKNELQKYEKSTYFKGVSIFKLNLEQLIYEKMVLLFEKLQPAQNKLEEAKINLQEQKNRLLLKTDFKKELNESRPTVAMKEAYMKPLLAGWEDDVNMYTEDIDFLKNKLNIINDLIKHKRLLLQVEAGLKE